MFSSPLAGAAGRSPQLPNAYRQVGVQTAIADASPHQLIAMLFDGFLDALAEARGAMRSHEIARKGRAIQRAVRIVEEGLRGGLDLDAGGKLAADLDSLYAYVCLRLTQANLHNDEQALEECRQLLQPLRDAWMSISSPDGRATA